MKPTEELKKLGEDFERFIREASGGNDPLAGWYTAISDWWFEKMVEREALARKEEKKKYEELLMWAEGVINGTAFSKESGHIWQHWIDEGKRLLALLAPDNNQEI